MNCIQLSHFAIFSMTGPGLGGSSLGLGRGAGMERAESPGEGAMKSVDAG